MGVVYLARDTTLERDVAIKVLPDDLSQDEHRRKRFEREAKLLASLHHSHIAAVYGLEEVDDRAYLMLEYVDGETLRQRLQRGPLRLEEALSVAAQIASGVEAAHARNIVHRDLKPANIKITSEGTVKVLDFGLAKSLDDSITGTTEVQGTQTTSTGVTLGTPGYMSPEQVRGEEADYRVDIWAFGCVLFEMLAGQRPFPSETTSEAIGSVLYEDPDFAKLPKSTPLTIRHLLGRCLTKDRKRRLHSIADARIEVEDALADPGGARWEPGTEARPAPVAPSEPRKLWALGILAALATGFGIWGWLRPTSAVVPPTPSRLVVELASQGRLEDLALSPDGRTLAYVLRGRGTETPAQLYVRILADWEARHIPEGADAHSLFFSPDSNWLGFVAGGALHKVPVVGGRPQKLCDVGAPSTGAAWVPGTTGPDMIVFGILGGGLFQVSAQGDGEFEALTELARGEGSHRSPHFLHDQNAILFSAAIGARLRLRCLDLASGVIRAVDLGDADPTDARYLPSGHMLYAQAKGLWAVGFDPVRLQTTTSAFWLTGDLGSNPYEQTLYSVSQSGTLVYAPGAESLEQNRLVEVNRDGTSSPLIDTPGHYAWPRLSPDRDQTRLAYQSQNFDLFVVDLLRGTRVRLTDEAERRSIWPVWTRDGEALTFGSTMAGPVSIYRKSADGSGVVQEILVEMRTQLPASWSPSGTLAFCELDHATGLDIWVLRDGAEPEPFANTVSDEMMPSFSPDGRWLAYVSNRTGKNEVYVAGQPGLGPGMPVSTGGGSEPVWSPDGETLFYRTATRLMAVAVGPDPVSDPGEVRMVLEEDYVRGKYFPNYDVFSRGERFVFVEDPDDSGGPARIQVVLDWFTELEERLETGK
jgi:serine/threonine-protein kinase